MQIYLRTEPLRISPNFLCYFQTFFSFICPDFVDIPEAVGQAVRCPGLSQFLSQSVSAIQTKIFIKQSLTQNNKTSDSDGGAKYLPFQTLQP